MNSTSQNFILKSDLSKIPNKDILQNLIKESKYLDTSFVNGLRRYIISKINTLAFEYSPTPQEVNYINFTKVLDKNSIFFKKALFWAHNEYWHTWHEGKELEDKGKSILEDERLLRVKTHILTIFNDYVTNHLQIQNQFYLTQSWTAINQKGDAHHSHIHPNCVFSCVYYVTKNNKWY